MANFIYRVRSKKNPAIIHVRMYQGNTLDVSTPTFLKIDPKNWNNNKKFYYILNLSIHCYCFLKYFFLQRLSVL